MLTTVEEIQTRKEALRTEINKKNKEIGSLWHNSIMPKKTANKGDFVASIVSKGITAFDAIMVARKLFKQYGHLFGKRKKK